MPNLKQIFDYGELDLNVNPSSPTIGLRPPYIPTPALDDTLSQTPYGLGYPYINIGPPTPSTNGNLYDYMSSVCHIRAQHTCTMGDEYNVIINEFMAMDSVIANDEEINIGFAKDIMFYDFYNDGTNYYREVIGYEFGIQEQTGTSTALGDETSILMDTANSYWAGGPYSKLNDILGDGANFAYNILPLITYTKEQIHQAWWRYNRDNNQAAHIVQPGLWNGVGDVPENFDSITDFYEEIKNLLVYANNNFDSQETIEITSPNNTIDEDGGNTTTILETIEEYGNIYNVGDNTGNIPDTADSQGFDSSPNKVLFQCNSKCNTTWNPENFPTKEEIRTQTYTNGQDEQTYDSAVNNDEGQPWWRCACDSKVFAVTQYIVSTTGVGEAQNYETFQYPSARTIYFKIQPDGGLARFGESYPHEEDIQYITAIQNNGAFIDYENNDVYDPYLEIISSTEEYGDSNNESSDFDITKFGHPDFEIKQTLLNSYDPYKAIQMGNDGLCSHIEFMYAPEVSWPGDTNYEKSETFYENGDDLDEDSYWRRNWGDGVYYNVTGNDNLEIYKNIIPDWYTGALAPTSLSENYDCSHEWMWGGATVSPVKEINVVCKNNKKINICKSNGSICGDSTFKYRDMTGLEICKKYAESQNNELLFSSNEDGRIPLGLFYFDEHDYIDENININSDSDNFEFQEPVELIKNGGGSVIRKNHGMPGDGAEGWGYFIRDGVNSPVDGHEGETFSSYYELGNLDNAAYRNLFVQQNPTSGQLYSGYYPYSYPVDIQPAGESLRGVNYQESMEWARWIQSKECYSHERCLQFSASSAWSNTVNMVGPDAGQNHVFEAPQDDQNWSIYNFKQHNNNQYRTINQIYRFNDGDLANLDYDSELEVSFMMKTLEAPYRNYSTSTTAGLPKVEAFIYCPGTTNAAQDYGVNANRFYSLADNNDFFAPGGGVGEGSILGSSNMYAAGTVNQYGSYSSLNLEESLSITGEEGYSPRGGAGIFQNSALKTWEKFSFTFKLAGMHKNDFTSKYIESQIIKDLSFVINSYELFETEFRAKILLDEFSVKESFNFTPDVYVTPTLGSDIYFPYQLTTYYDSALLTEQELKTVQAPLKVSFYFYPRHKSNFIFNVEKDINYKDFKLGKFSIYNVDWGDGEKDYQDEPKKIDYGTLVNHYYKKSGIYTISGYMLRVKTKYQNSENDINTLGLSKVKRFELRINILEGSDEDFTYFNLDGFSFIPYKNTLPIIGGISNQSYYYKSIMRQLGFIGDTKIDLNFLNSSDKLKTELALLKIGSEDISNTFDGLKVLPAYTLPRTFSGETIYNGLKPNVKELGKSIGDCDLTNIKYYNTPKSIWEMLGFVEDDLEIIGNPNEPRYWKNIIPKDYSIYNRDGILGGESIDTYSEQEWLEQNEYGNTYYYPVLPKYGADGKFLKTIDGNGDYIPNTYPNDKIPFSLKAPITDENENNENLNINIISEQFDQDVLTDSSGNKNFGFTFGDYKPKFDNKNLRVNNIKKNIKLKISKIDESF